MDGDLCDYMFSLWSESDCGVYSDSGESDELDCSDPPIYCQCDPFEDNDLEIWTHPHPHPRPHPLKLKAMVNVFVILRRWSPIKPQSTEFGQNEVLNILMEKVIEAREVGPLQGPASYSRTNVMMQCAVCDQFNKTLVRSGGSPRLQAVTLKRGNSQYKVVFSMEAYVSPSAGLSSAQPVCLGISKSNWYLACSAAADAVPHLVLRKVDGDLSTIQDGGTNDDLLFFRKETGTSINTFESVKYRGWFISTALEENQLVEMSKVSAERITGFELKREN